jgi:hypothetical protein
MQAARGRESVVQAKRFSKTYAGIVGALADGGPIA